MMPPAATALAVALLLVTPGPTNTLIALAGAERGWRGALRLIPAELAGYLLTVVPLVLAGAALLDSAPAAKTALTAVAAAWVAWLALTTWRLPREGAGPTVTHARVFVTTLLNPKALAFGLLILPAPEPTRVALNLAVFAGLVVAVASGWAALGASARSARERPEPGLPPSWRRGTALLLAALSVWLAGKAAGVA